MVTKTRRPRAPEAPPAPPPKVRAPPRKPSAPDLSAKARRARFAAEYLVDFNGTKAAIRAGYTKRSAHAQGCRLLKHDEVRAIIAAHQQKMDEKREAVQQKVIDRYEVSTERITRELALLGFSNMADYGRVGLDGEFVVDLTETTRDEMAALSGVKTTRSVRTIGDVEIETITSEVKVAQKRAALVDLGKITGMFKDGIDVTVPVRFIVERTTGPKRGEEAA